MKNKETKIKKMKSCLGFTMYDLIIAISIFTLFTGVIGTWIYNSLRANYQTKLTGMATNYAIQILENIDKIPYEQVQNGMEDNYIDKLSIPENFKLSIEVENYNDGNNKEDLIKEIKLTITYDLSKESRKLAISHLKIKEI